MNTMKTGSPLYYIWMTLLLVLSGAATADSEATVASLLAQDKPPPGVAFEVVQGDPDGLNWAIPVIRGYIERLRTRYPEIPVAVISHGQEQFSLLRENTATFDEAHELARSFMSDLDVPVQVCGNHAGMYGHNADDYPDYVEVVDAAPRQIGRYREMGYKMVVVRRM